MVCAVMCSLCTILDFCIFMHADAQNRTQVHIGAQNLAGVTGFVPGLTGIPDRRW